MKHLSAFLCAFGLFWTLSISAANYCATQSWGCAGTSVTGGGSATPTLVTSESELKNALKSNKVVIITKDITVSNQVSIENKTHITLMALPGKKLISTSQEKNTSGILAIKTSTNIILRNITFEGPGAFDCDGRDNLTVTGSQNIWVDHCDFQDGCDGNFDINSTSDNISVTWCRFRYLKAPRPRDEGDTNPDHTDDHRFSNLVGSSKTDKPSDGTYNITYGFCWWDEGCKQRMTRCRNALIHYLNCYWNSSVADYYIGPENVSSYFEGCTFAGKANSASKIWNQFNSTTNYCNFVNCIGNLPSNSGSVAAPSYTYDALSAAEAKSYVINSTCGAGATLTVTTTGEVSSSCDSGSVTPVDPTIASGECCVDLSMGNEPTVANGGIPTEFSQLALTVNLAKGKWVDGYLSMDGNADYITFNFSAYNSTIESVVFDVTIPNLDASQNKNTIAYHWNSEENNLHTISSKATEMVHITAPADAKSFTIQRSAGTNTRISQVCFQIKAGIATAIETPQNEGAAHKVLRQGLILIQREGRWYNLLGGRIL